jgi:L-gulonate 3-dehydrogenase
MLDDLGAAGLLDDPAAAAGRLSVAGRLEAAVAGADYVQESVPEDAATKTAVIREIDRAAPAGAMIGSSTSTIPGSRFLADIAGRARCIVAHPANPPHLMPVVEIVPAPWNEPASVERVREVMAAIGQVPVVVKKEIEGFVMNRLQTAVVAEAVGLVARGVIEPDDLDAVMKHSLGLRWALMGPFETMDLNAPQGFYDYVTRYGGLYQQMGRELFVAEPWPEPALAAIEESRRRATPKPELAKRTRWRDRALMRLMAMKRDMEAGSGEEDT